MRHLIIFIFILLCFRVKTQETRMFWNSQTLYNPAASGLNQKIDATLIGRAKWLGYNNAPLYGNAIYNMKAGILHGGFGVNFNCNRIGFIHDKGFNINYSYHIDFKNKKKLGIGVSGGLNRKRFDISSLYIRDYDDPIIVSKNTDLLFNYKFGLFYVSNHLELGLSSTFMKVIEKNTPYLTNSNIYWIFSSYQFEIGKNIEFKPNLLLNPYKHYIGISSGLLMTYKQRFWTGITYIRYNNIGVMFGYDIIGMFRLGYSWNSTSFGFNFISGNHEIILAIILK
jgi:type IX secretion system PorP/SprF family membrane protein